MLSDWQFIGLFVVIAVVFPGVPVLLAGLINPGYLIFALSQTGSGQANACEIAVAEATAMKGTRDETVDVTP